MAGVFLETSYKVCYNVLQGHRELRARNIKKQYLQFQEIRIDVPVQFIEIRNWRYDPPF